MLRRLCSRSFCNNDRRTQKGKGKTMITFTTIRVVKCDTCGRSVSGPTVSGEWKVEWDFGLAAGWTKTTHNKVLCPACNTYGTLAPDTIWNINPPKPPLGAQPHQIWIEKRVGELSRAIHDYVSTGNYIEGLGVWSKELAELIPRMIDKNDR